MADLDTLDALRTVLERTQADALDLARENATLRAQLATAQQHIAPLQADPRLALTADDAREMLALAARGTHVLQARVQAIFDAMVGEEGSDGDE